MIEDGQRADDIDKLFRRAQFAPVIAEQLMEVLASIRNDGVTVLLVEQDIHLALSGADRGYVMETGRIVHSGTAKDLIDDPQVRKAYLGL